MTVHHAEAVVTAGRKVHDQVWSNYWREGKTELRPDQVINLIRDVRVTAHITEERLPTELLLLLAQARTAQEENGSMVSLAKLIEALKLVFLPPRPGV